MIEHNHDQFITGVFITFSGNCKRALSFYQSCFGGQLQFETFKKELDGYPEMPVVSGSLVADKIMIYGSDLVHNEGRILGNYISVFLHCRNIHERKELIRKMNFEQKLFFNSNDDQKLIELIDAFDVRWILGV